MINDQLSKISHHGADATLWNFYGGIQLNLDFHGRCGKFTQKSVHYGNEVDGGFICTTLETIQRDGKNGAKCQLFLSVEQTRELHANLGRVLQEIDNASIMTQDTVISPEGWDKVEA